MSLPPIIRWTASPRFIGAVSLGVYAMTASHAQDLGGRIGANDETIGSCLVSESNLIIFASPEKTWSYFLRSLRAGNLKEAMGTFVAGDAKTGFSSLVKSMSADKMRAMADSFGPLTNESDMGNVKEYLVIRNSETGPTGFTVQFEYHLNCGGWRIVGM